MGELQDIYKRIASAYVDAARKVSSLADDMHSAANERDRLRLKKEKALKEGSYTDYLDADNALKDIVLKLDFSTAAYNAASRETAIPHYEASQMYGELLHATKAAYHDRARQMIPLMKELERLSGEAEEIARTFADMAGRLCKMQQTAEFTAYYPETGASFSKKIKARRQQLEYMLQGKYI